MKAERSTRWLQRFQKEAHRLFDARPSWLFGGNTSSEPNDSHAMIAAAFQTLCANLGIRTADRYRTVMLTSPAPGEGKSMLTVNLALRLARRRAPVLLVDADLRRPVVHKIFQLPNAAGLSHVLKGEAGLDEVIRKTSEGLHVLTSGMAADDPSLLFETDRMRELVSDLAKRFEITLFDTPPVLSTPDATLIAPLVDWILLVLFAGSTIKEDAQRAKTMLEKADGKVLGSILNGVDKNLSPGYHKYANYYSVSSEKS